MSKRTTRRLRAGSLLESVLALTVIAGAMSAAVALHTQVITSDKAMDRLCAWSAIQGALGEPWNGPGTTTIEVVPGWPVERTVTPTGPELVRMDLICSDHGRVILQHSVILPFP
jgi:hypothetical protein